MRKEPKAGYFPASEILELFPELETKLNWGPRELSILHRCNLVAAYYDRSRKITMYAKESIRNLVRHANHVIESQKVKIQTISHENN